MNARLLPSVFAALLGALLAQPGAHAADTTGATPAAVTGDFYRAYVARFRSDHDPLLDLMLAGSPLVSASLLADLRSRMDDDADLDDDYFLRSPHGVRPCHSVDVATVRTAAEDATVRVTLGARRTKPWGVAVSLARQAGVWRIRGVTPDRGVPSREAAGRAMADC